MYEFGMLRATPAIERPHQTRAAHLCAEAASCASGQLIIFLLVIVGYYISVSHIPLRYLCLSIFDTGCKSAHKATEARRCHSVSRSCDTCPPRARLSLLFLSLSLLSLSLVRLSAYLLLPDGALLSLSGRPAAKARLSVSLLSPAESLLSLSQGLYSFCSFCSSLAVLSALFRCSPCPPCAVLIRLLFSFLSSSRESIVPRFSLSSFPPFVALCLRIR